MVAQCLVWVVLAAKEGWNRTGTASRWQMFNAKGWDHNACCENLLHWRTGHFHSVQQCYTGCWCLCTLRVEFAEHSEHLGSEVLFSGLFSWGQVPVVSCRSCAWRLQAHRNRPVFRDTFVAAEGWSGFVAPVFSWVWVSSFFLILPPTCKNSIPKYTSLFYPDLIHRPSTNTLEFWIRPQKYKLK